MENPHPYPIKEPRTPGQPLPQEDPPLHQVDPIVAADVMFSQGRGTIPSDTLGSYTGSSVDDLVPEQDPDDL